MSTNESIEFRLQAAQNELLVADMIFHSVGAVMVTDAQAHILRINRAFTDLTGYASADVVGKTPRILRSGHHDDAFYAAMQDTIARTDQWQGEIWDRRKGGGVFPKWMTISAVKDDHGAITHFVATYIDISERKRAEDRIEQLAFYDVLTGLPNRALMQERLKLAIATNADTDHYGALLLADLDRFRTINDALGHTQGDALLQQAGLRLVDCVQGGDMVARIGGDEFAVILADLSGSQEQAAYKAQTTARQMLAVLGRDYQLASSAHLCSASIGVVLFQGKQANAESLLKQAELAMYQAKSDGRNRQHFFDVALERAIIERIQLERELREAIGAGQLVLHYQPQVTVVAGICRIVGAEALVRWAHPLDGLLGPGQFIALAEETGLILPLGAWVLDTACQQLAAWASEPETAGLSLSVNVSAAQFLQDNFVTQVLTSLAHARADPCRLKLELTENLLLNNADAVIATMNELRAYGLRFSLDDFGTGYSSLSYLKRLPLDQLKIDQSFVRDLEVDTNDAAIVRSIIALAHSLDLAVIAEGVETAAQKDFLMHLGCHDFQGYYFSWPLPLADFDRHLSD
ncbi:EAL domain-containing protein [Alcaligenaceae bacterium CGII-47]|nr:EAL domain-containing protein [Alcaligenaceae bacterium CGII-47]